MNTMVTQLQSAYLGLAARASLTARRVPGVSTLLDAWTAYTRDEMGIIAAGLAYYLLLTLFPLLLLLIAASTPFVSSDAVIRQVGRFVGDYLPAVQSDLRSLLREVVVARGPVTVFAILGLFWSSSGVFDLIQRGLDRAWHVPAPRPLWRQRLISLVTVILLGGLFALSFATSALARSGVRFRLDFANRSVEILSLVFTLILNYALFAYVYRIFPNVKLSWRSVRLGALVASILWEIAKYAFVWYLLNFARLNLVYGSVGAIIALLVWGYITATILLFGAELCALPLRKGLT